MGLYFRKRRSLLGNLLNVNFSRSGIGLSVGVRGFRVGLSSSGRKYVSAGLPGSGIYYRHFAKRGRNATKPEPAKPEITPAIADESLLHPTHGQIHNAAYNAGFLFGWLLILTPFALLGWLLWLGLR
jgi:hypothetical protein